MNAGKGSYDRGPLLGLAKGIGKKLKVEGLGAAGQHAEAWREPDGEAGALRTWQRIAHRLLTVNSTRKVNGSKRKEDRRRGRGRKAHARCKNCR